MDAFGVEAHGEQKTWETFKLLRGEGYSSEEIFELHRQKRDLQVAIEKAGPDRKSSQTVETILNQLESEVR